MKDSRQATELRDTFVASIHQVQGILHRICSLYTWTPEERQDLWQEILLQLWRTYPTFRGHSQFSTWLYRVALNTALMHRRSRMRRNPTMSIDEIEPPAAPENMSGSEHGVRLLTGSIRELEQLDRAVILLRLEEKSYQEIAEITGLSEGAVSLRLVRIREKLRKALASKGYSGENYVG